MSTSNSDLIQKLQEYLQNGSCDGRMIRKTQRKELVDILQSMEQSGQIKPPDKPYQP